MPLEVLAAAADTKLCLLSDLKTRLGVTGSGSDTALTGHIKAASAAIVSFIGRDLALQQYRETLPGNSRRRLSLSRYPLDRDSSSLTIDGTADTDYSVDSATVGILWRQGDWTESIQPAGQDGKNNIAVTYKAGYVLPGWISDWSAAMTPSVGDWVRPSVPVKDFLFICTTAGTAHASTQPTWPTTVAGTVTDGTVVWTARHALELPDDIEEAAILTAAGIYNGNWDVPAGLRSERLGSMELTYQDASSAPAQALPMAARALLEPHR